MTEAVVVPAVEGGLYRGWSADKYHAFPALSQSVLKEFARSPMHARYAMTHPSEDTKAMILGEAIHFATLQRDLFDVRYPVAPDVDRRTKDGKAAWAAFIDEHPNAVPLKLEERNLALDVSDAVQAHPIASKLLAAASMIEASVIWTDEPTGIRCKARPDIVTVWDGWTTLVDLKTTRDASAAGFTRAIGTYQYHIQGRWYLRSMDSIDPRARKFMHVAVESDPPHAVAVYEMTYAALWQAESEIKSFLAQYAECQRAGNWPGYPVAIAPIDLPRWAQAKEIE